MKNLLFANILMTTLVTSAYAEGGQVGNGGDAIVCYSDISRNKITSVELLDHWEQEQIQHFPGGIQLGNQSNSLTNKLELVTKRISKFDPDMSNEIYTLAEGIITNLKLYITTPNELPEIDDANPKIIPTSPNCYIEQFAVQWKDIKSGQRRFAISAKIFNNEHTSNDTKFGLILHETLYRIAIKNGAQNSDKVRSLNYIISTKFLESASKEHYINLIINSPFTDSSCEIKNYDGLKIYAKKNGNTEHRPGEYGNLCIQTSLTFNNAIYNFNKNSSYEYCKNCYKANITLQTDSNSNHPKFIKLKEETKWKKFNGNFELYINTKENIQPSILDFKSDQEEKNQWITVKLQNDTTLKCRINLLHFKQSNLAVNRCITFEEFEISILNRVYTISKESIIDINDSLGIQSATLSSNSLNNSFKLPNSNEVVFVQKNSEFTLNNNYEVINAQLEFPIIRVFNGKKIKITNIQHENDHLIAKYKQQEKNTYENKRMYNGNPDVDRAKYCEELGYKFSSFEINQATEEYIKKEQIYNITTGKVDNVFNRTIKIIKKITCSGYIEFN